MRRILKHISELLFIIFILCGCSINPWFTVGLDVDTTAPELSITSHTDFDYVSGTFDLKGTCSDNVAITKVLVSIKASDGSYKASELKSVINKGHWTYTVATTGDHPMADGEYTFTVQAFDAEKNESSSSVKSVTLYIDNIPSKVTISYPLLRSSVSAWDNTAEIYLPEHTDYYLNDTFYIQGSISEDFAVDNLYIRLTEVTYNNEETPNYLDVTIDSEINITSGGTIKDNTLSIIKEKKDTVSIWSWKIRLQEKITGADILTPKYYKISTKVTDAAGNSDQHNHGYICVLPQSDYPYCLFNDYGDKIPVNTPLTGKACDDDGIAAVTIQLCDRFGNEIPGKTDILPKDMQIMNDGTYTPSNATALGKFYNWKTENSIPNIGGEYILRVMITDINGRSSWSYYGDNQYIHNYIYRQKDLLMMDLSAPSIDIQGLKGKVTVVNANDKPLDFDEYTDIVDASGDFTLVCNASDASQITKIYLAQLLPGVTEAEQNALTAIDPETSNIKWNIDWDEQDSVVIGHIRYFRLYEYNGDEIQAKLTKYQPLNIYTDFSNTYEKKIFYVYAENASEKTTVSYRAIAIEPDKPEIKLIAPNAGATLTNVFSIRAEVTDFTGLQDLTLSAYQKWQSDHEKLLTFSELQNDASFAADASGHFQKVTINDLPSSLFGETFIGGVCTLTMTAKDLYGNTVSEKVQFHIDTDEPVIKNISAKPAVGTYKAGDTIRLQMEISKEVSISGGTPTLTLALDNGVTATADLSNDPSDGTAAPNILPFQYTVAAGQNTQLLNCIGLNLNGAVIQDAQHYAVDPANLPTDTIGSLKSNAAIRIDTVSPTITNVKTLTPNGSYSTHSNITTVEIQVIFSENVLISGTPRLKLNATNGGSSCYAVYDGKNVDESGNPKASNKATFIYTIKSGDTTNNVPLTWKEWDDNGSTITDTANSGRKDNNIVSGNPFDVPDKDLSNDFIDSHQWSQKIYIDTTAPVITGITLSNADSLQQQYDSADHAYYCNAGKKINLAVDFSEAVNITSSPTIEFADNITTKALYTSGKGSSRLIFSYTVTDNDNTSSGLYLKVKNIANSIQDNAGNPMNAALPNGGVLDKNIIIDTNKPAKPAVTYTAASNAVHNYEGAAVNVYTGLSAGNTIGVTLASTTDTSSYQYCWTENNIALGWETGSGNISKTFGSGKAEGFYQEYYVSLQLRDKAGNLSDESDVKHFIIDTDKPKLTGVSTTAVSGSSLIASESGIYMTGEKINISLEFNKSVTVSSPLTIRLSNGKELTIDTGTEAKHLEGNSAYYLTKEYTVASSDTDTTKLDITSISSGEVKDDLNNTLSAAALTSEMGSNPLSKSQEIAIDTTAPSILSISTDITGWYTTGSIIPITVRFSEAVRYTGDSPTLTLNNKNGSSYNKASYISGSGTSEWMFSYGVNAGDTGYGTTNGDSNTALTTSNNLKVRSIDGTIKDMAGVKLTGNALNTALPSENMKTNKVGIDTTKPASVNLSAVDNEGKALTEFTYDETTQTYITGKSPVNVTVQPGEANALYYVTKNGDPVYEWKPSNEIGAINCAADTNEYLSYTVAVRQKDPAGNISDERSVSFTIDNAEVKLESISTTHQSGTCTIGANIPITLKFNKKIKITQAISLTLNATRSGTPITLTISPDSAFNEEKTVSYNVVNGDTTPEVLNVTAVSGKVKDNLDKEVTITTETLKEISNLAATKQITIDTAPPALLHISTNADGWYNAGKLIAITMTFSEDIKVGTTAPTMQLSSRGTAVYSSHSGENMTFIYTVGANDTTGSSKNLSVTKSLGNITDQAGNTFSNIGAAAIKKAANLSTNAQIGIDTAIGAINVKNITANAVINNKDTIGYLVAQTLRFSGITDSGSGLKSAVYTKAGVSGNLTIGDDTDIVCSAEEGTSSVYVFSAAMTDNAENTSTIEFTVTIDGTNISLDKISSDKANGTYTGGTNIPITLTFSTPVKVTSALTVTFNNGDTMTIPAAAANADYSATLSGTLTATRQKQDSPLTVTAITGTVQDSRGAEKAVSDWADHITALNTKTSNLADSRSIYIDTTAPTIQSVSTAASDGWYRDGSHIYLTLTFDEDVQISGSPALTLSSGGTAIYQSNSGPEVTFLYTVGNSDSTSGQTLKATGIVTNSGTIIDTAKESGNAFDSSALSSKALKKSDKTTSAAVGIDNAIKPIVIKNGSTVITGKSYTSDNSLKYYRSQTLTVSWTNDSGAASTATYTVNGESRGIITNGGTISCPLAEDAIASYLVVVTKADTAGNSTSAQTEIQINGEEIKLQSVTSETPNGTYIPTNTINLTLNFNKAVQLTQAATLTLNNGKELSISATNSYSTTLTAQYTVAAGEDTPAGENLAVSSFSAGTVQDERGTDTARTLSALLAAASNLNESRAIKIDTVKPTLSLMTTSADGWYKANDQIAVTLTFSEEVKVTGTPTITMSTGKTAAYQTGSGTKNLMFVYKVAAGNTTGANKNLYISSLSGLTGRITDSAGNAYTPISSEYGTGKLKKASATSTAATVGIDTAAPTLTITNSSDGNAVINDGGSVNKAAAQTIKFTLSDGGSALNSSLTKYTVNGTSYPLTNNETLNCAETAGTKNAYAITATVTDNAGNVTTKSFTVIIDGTPLMLETITSTQASGTYKSGVTVPITLTFNNPVKVTSALTVTFNNGDTMTIPVNETYLQSVSADYSTSSETSTPLTVSSITGTVEDARGTVKAISTTQWSSALSAANNLDASKSIIIDTTAPTVSSVTTETAAGWYKAETLIRIMLNCNETVKVSGTPTLSLNLINGATTASYISGSGTNTLTFAYTVKSSDSTGTSQNLSVTRINGTITDIADNTISTIGTKQLDKNIGIDTSAPKTLTVSGITANAVKYDASALTISNFGDSTGSGNASYTIVINGTSYSADKTNTTDITYSGLPAAAKTALTVAAGGRQTFTVTAYQTDKAGNNSASSSSLTFTIDRNPAKITSVTASRSNEIIKNGDTLDIVFNFSRALTSVSLPTVNLSNGVTGTLSKVTTTQYKYTYNVSTASSQDTSGAALKITGVSGSITDALTTQTLSSLWSDNTTYNISGYNVIVDTIAPTLKSSYPTASYNDSTGKATVTYKFSENVEKVGGKKFTLTRTAYAAPIILTPAEYNEYYSQASGIKSYYERTINGTSSSGVVDKTSKYVLKYQYDPTESALVNLFNGIGYYKSEITIESSNVSISGDTLTVTIPAEQLMTGESYTISADTGLIKDLVGNQCGTIADKTFTTGNKPQPPVIRVNKISGRGTTAAQTTFKVNTVTSGATIKYNLGSGSFGTPGTDYSSSVTMGDNSEAYIYRITANATKNGSSSATAYEMAFKTTLKTAPTYDNGYSAGEGTFYVFRGGDQASGSNTVDNFPLSWDEKSVGSNTWTHGSTVGDDLETALAQYGMLLADGKKAITWGATEDIYFHGLTCKVDGNILKWAWQEGEPKHVTAGSAANNTDTGKIERNYHDYDGKNY